MFYSITNKYAKRIIKIIKVKLLEISPAFILNYSSSCKVHIKMNNLISCYIYNMKIVSL